MDKNLTVIVPAYNEEANIAAAISGLVEVLDELLEDYEILVMNDGSKDSTGSIADEIAESNPRVTVVHNQTNLGYGPTYTKALQFATKTYVATFSGDNDAPATFLKPLIAEMGKYDVVTNYYSITGNSRSFIRRGVSRAFVTIINYMFGLRMKYFNGSHLCRAALVRSIRLRSKGLAINSECLVKLLKMDCTYTAVPFDHIGRKGGNSTALSFKNIIDSLQTILILLKDITFSPKVQKPSLPETQEPVKDQEEMIVSKKI